ncbi:MAG: hypothetical protein IT440_05550 [Phycisphaeraceae bacterium]|nr:hypothetical protein [Phycisphaeraceae bacterium]
MKNQFTLFVGAIVVLFLVAYMFAFQVRYDEVAVVTTFNHAGPNAIITKPGIEWRLPWPIQAVTKYSNRVQVLEDQLEEQQTADEKAVIVRMYVAWRVTDPLAFFTRLDQIDNAPRHLSPLLRDTRGIISKYTFDQLVNSDPKKLKLDAIEKEARELLQSRVDASGYGITVDEVGLRRLVLPEKTTESVFTTMRKTRERMAENAKQEGQAQAAAIKAEARSASDRIMAFAERYAQAVRAKGDQEAAQHYSKFAADENFAIFLREMEALQKMLSKNSTFVLDARNFDVIERFRTEALTTKGK